MIDEINVLKHCEGRDFGCCPSEKASGLFCVISDHHKLVVELREEGFDSFIKQLLMASNMATFAKNL